MSFSQICNTTLNTTVNVRGIVNGKRGDFNIEMIKPNYTPPPKPTLRTSTALRVATDPSTGMCTFYLKIIQRFP